MNLRNRSAGVKGVKLLVNFSFFFFGLVIGMLIIHFVGGSNDSSGEENKVVEEQSQEEETPRIVNVYIPERDVVYGNIPVNSYNVDNFKIDEGFMAYFDEDGNKISHLGCDLSYHNEDVDWDALAASPVEFVMLRCGYRGYTEGGLKKDEKFDEYAAEANRVGLKVGVYFYTQAVSVEEAREEAKFCIETIKDYDISYPVAIDTEYVNDASARTNKQEISNELRSEMIRTFCDTVKEAGYYPMMYAGENWMRRNMDLNVLSDIDVWAPQYYEKNDFMYDFTIWQYTEKGSVPGIKENVDLNVSMVDYASFVPALRSSVETDGKIIEINVDN